VIPLLTAAVRDLARGCHVLRGATPAGLGGGAALRQIAFDAYLTFERVETEVRARNAALAGELEDAFASLRARAGAGAEATSSKRFMPGCWRDWSARAAGRRPELGREPLMQSFVLLLREGFGAILIVAALMAFLAKAGAVERPASTWPGAWAAVGASLVTAAGGRAAVRDHCPGQREALEGRHHARGYQRCCST